jgi:pantoate--beta-alanine ligase
MTELATVRTVADLRAHVGAWKKDGSRVALVPTMGALHEGHFSLIRQALTRAPRVVVSLFVNPRQFGPNEDFTRYPRDEAKDADALAKLGVHLLYAPGVQEMYPEGALTKVSVPELGDMLEGEFRPGFFTGVATVVTKLLTQTQPDVALFGEKDYQQLLVIKRLVADLDLPVTIEGCPTVREGDGVALSSRNAYLDAEQRRKATGLVRALRGAANRARLESDYAAIEEAAKKELAKFGFAKVDYIALRNAETLGSPQAGKPMRALGAAWMGTTRLIDNLAIPA